MDVYSIGNYLTTFGRPPGDDHQMLKDLGLEYTWIEESAPAPTSDHDQNAVALPVLNP